MKPEPKVTLQSDDCPDYDGENDTEFCKFILRADGSVLCETDRDWTLAYLSPTNAIAFAREILATQALTPDCVDCGKPVPQRTGQVLISAKSGFDVLHAACFKKRKDAEVGGNWSP